jgi:hypothetical protein
MPGTNRGMQKKKKMNRGGDPMVGMNRLAVKQVKRKEWLEVAEQLLKAKATTYN